MDSDSINSFIYYKINNVIKIELYVGSEQAEIITINYLNYLIDNNLYRHIYSGTSISRSYTEGMNHSIINYLEIYESKLYYTRGFRNYEKTIEFNNHKQYRDNEKYAFMYLYYVTDIKDKINKLKPNKFNCKDPLETWITKVTNSKGEPYFKKSLIISDVKNFTFNDKIHNLNPKYYKIKELKLREFGINNSYTPPSELFTTLLNGFISPMIEDLRLPYLEIYKGAFLGVNETILLPLLKAGMGELEVIGHQNEFLNRGSLRRKVEEIGVIKKTRELNPLFTDLYYNILTPKGTVELAFGVFAMDYDEIKDELINKYYLLIPGFGLIEYFSNEDLINNIKSIVDYLIAFERNVEWKMKSGYCYQI